MNVLKRLSLLPAVIVVLFGWFGGATPVFACSCAMATSAEQFDGATAVFVGTVSDITTDGRNNLVDFTVSESRKGLDAAAITVRTGQWSAACGFEFAEGNEYLVYAYEEQGQLATGLCTGTSLLAVAQNDIDEPGVVNSSVEPGAEAEKGSIISTVIVGVLAFGAGALTACIVRRKNKIA